MDSIKNMLHGFSHLFFPHTCAGCGSDYVLKGQVICLQCNQNLPLTKFENFHNNPLEKVFFGRVAIRHAMSLIYFTKDSFIQNLLHQFKYQGKKEIGQCFGQMMGRAIIQSNRFHDIETVVPLPLFPAKEKKRGYNQSTVLCEAIVGQLKLPLVKDAIIRNVDTETQTHKSRIERWRNIEGKFELKKQDPLINKHILLVDDVVTTGATLEACAAELLKIPKVEVSIATMAFANM
jgi:ComF family protein